MCGIVGYIGKQNATDILLNGLSHLEYRGYDSSGVALYFDNDIEIYKASGKLENLKNILVNKDICKKSQMGIGHIRWATHGLPTTENAHPHTCNCKSLVLVHNGIIENYKELKTELVQLGCEFKSETDTEVVAHLIAHKFAQTKDLLEAVKSSIKMLKGAYAFCVMHKKDAKEIIVAKKNAPLLIGVGEDENFVASDIPAIIDYTKKAIYLNDGEVARIERNNIEIFNSEGEKIENKVEHLPFEAVSLSKMGYKHFMLKEIHEQGDAIRNVLSGKLVSPNSEVVLNDFKLKNLEKIKRIQIIACGTSYHAGIVGKYVIEQLTKIPVDVETSGEYIYRSTVANSETLAIAISQSGETADTITAIKQIKGEGAHVVVITNRPDSTMARLADSLMPIDAGIEVSVAATKSYLAQLISLYLLAIYFAQNVMPNKNQEAIKCLKTEILQLPSKIEMILNNKKEIKEIAKKYSNSKNFIFIARGMNYPTALEGALKLKEISYINATGYPSGELKHGPIAMLDETMPVLAILNDGVVYDKVLSNCQEAKARRAMMIGVASHIDEKNRDLFDDLIIVPKISDIISPALNIVVLQLMAYYIAEFLGKDVDQPRNLAKSVTVE